MRATASPSRLSAAASPHRRLRESRSGRFRLSSPAGARGIISLRQSRSLAGDTEYLCRVAFPARGMTMSAGRLFTVLNPLNCHASPPTRVPVEMTRPGPGRRASRAYSWRRPTAAGETARWRRSCSSACAAARWCDADTEPEPSRHARAAGSRPAQTSAQHLRLPCTFVGPSSAGLTRRRLPDGAPVLAVAPRKGTPAGGSVTPSTSPCQAAPSARRRADPPCRRDSAG